MQCGRLDGSYWAAMAEPREWRIVVRPGLPGPACAVPPRVTGERLCDAAGDLFLEGLVGTLSLHSLWREPLRGVCCMRAGGLRFFRDVDFQKCDHRHRAPLNAMLPLSRATGLGTGRPCAGPPPLGLCAQLCSSLTSSSVLSLLLLYPAFAASLVHCQAATILLPLVTS
jgi:hypothetical protein